MLPRLTTVVTPAETRDLTTIETVKAALQLPDTTDEDYLAQLIAQASATAESYCGRAFAPETVRDEFDPPRWGYAAECLVLSRRPVIAITSAVENDVALISTDYELDKQRGMMRRLCVDGSLGQWRPRTKVTYSAGYVLPGYDGRTLPEDIEAAVVGLVKYGWHARARDPLVRSESTPGVYEVTYWIASVGESGDLPPEAAAKLNRYRDYAV